MSQKEENMVRKKWKSGAALMLSALMILGMTGCGGDAEESSQSAPEESRAEQQTESQEQADDA